MNGKKKQIIYRLAPCPPYDVEGTESWLTDMAREGWHLHSDSFFGPLAKFEYTSKENTVYRLEAAQKEAGFWADNMGRPEEEALELNEVFGWEYVTNRGQFHIYRGSGQRELNTDPQVQALALDAVRKRERNSFFTLLVWIVIYPLVFLRHSLLITAIEMGSHFFLFTAGLMLWFVWDSLKAVLSLRKLRKKLAMGELPAHSNSWKTMKRQHLTKGIVRTVLVLLWIGIALSQWSSRILEEHLIPLEEYTGNPPFATIADLAPEGNYSFMLLGISNTMQEKGDPLAPLVMEWNEIATVRLPDGGKIEGSLYVDYYETAHPLIAQTLAKEYVRTDSRSKRYAPLQLTLPETDFAAAYTGELHGTTAVMQKGPVIIHATFFQYEPGLTPQEWVDLLAKSLE